MFALISCAAVLQGVTKHVILEPASKYVFVTLSINMMNRKRNHKSVILPTQHLTTLKRAEKKTS